MQSSRVPTRAALRGHPLSRVGLGALHFSLEPRPRTEDAIALIHSALGRGITLIDTADSYCRDEFDKNHNEDLIRKALDSWPGGSNDVIVATKGGMIRPRGEWITCGEPQYLEKAIVSSHRALGGQKPIDLWQFHVPDPRYDFLASLKPAVAAVQHGLIRWIGLSNVTLDQIRRAQEVIEIVSIQNAYNPWNRQAEFDGILEHCERENLLFFAWSPLGGSQNQKNLARIPYLMRLSAERHISLHTLVLAWLMAKSPIVIPIPGTVNPAHMEAWVDACYLTLTPDEIHRIDCSVYHGTRAMRISETPAPQSEACLFC